jgi:periplasmic protein CpxP/Spy
MISIKHVVAATFLAITLPFASSAIVNAHEQAGAFTQTYTQKGALCQKHDGEHAKSSWGHWKAYSPTYLLRGLNLTEAQKDQVFTIMHAQAPIMRDTRKQYWALKKELMAVTQADQFDDTKAQQIANKIATLAQSKIMNRARTHAKILEILTPEQREESLASIEKMHLAHVQQTSYKSGD